MDVEERLHRSRERNRLRLVLRDLHQNVHHGDLVAAALRARPSDDHRRDESMLRSIANKQARWRREAEQVRKELRSVGWKP